VANARVGEAITIRTAGGRETALRIAGTVHAAGLAPGWMDHVVSGFVPWSSIARGDPESERSEVRILATERDEGRLRELAVAAGHWLVERGTAIRRAEIPPPGRHPHADQMDTFLFLLGAFGSLTLALSGVLMATLITTLLAKQVREIGIMKAIGADSGQIAALYLGQVALLATFALVVGLPLGIAAGQGYAGFATRMLNADLQSWFPPPWIVAVQIAAGLIVPLLVSCAPVVAASRTTVHQALQGALAAKPWGARRLDGWCTRIRWLPRPLLLSLRTTVQRRARLALTVGTLAAGGAVFLSALNVSGGWDRAVAEDFESRRYDVDLRLSRPQPAVTVARVLAAVPEVVRAEFWVEGEATRASGGEPSARAAALGARLAHGAPATAGHARIRLLGPDPGTRLLALPVLRGRWLAPGDSDQVVINHAFAASDTSLRVGGPLRLVTGSRTVTWTIAGVVKEIAAPPTVYAAPATILAALDRTADFTRGARIVTREHDRAGQDRAAQAIERALAAEGIPVAGIQSRRDVKKALEDHLVIITSTLLLAAGLVVIVGGLGLTSTLALNVLERTREFGILAAIGAAPRVLARFVVLEGVLMGLASWVVAIALSVPATMAVGAVAGRIFIRTPLAYVVSPAALLVWLVLVVVLAALASLYPALRASRMQIREALAHE
jgi:putative ABC transport system permease protein